MNEADAVRMDEEARVRIRGDLDTNFFVEAGAGSGKTTVLVERMTNMVKAGKDVSRICAITFTKAAAGEFYQRFRDRLREEAGKGDEACAAALRDLDLCFMGTIDSFCNMILSEHPAKAGIPSNARVITDEEFKKAARRCYADIQHGLHGPELRAQCRVFREVNSRPDALFTVMMAEMANRRQTRFVYEHPAAEPADEQLEEEKASLIHIAEVLSAHPEAAYSGEKANEKAWKTFRSQSSLLKENWESHLTELADLLKSLKGLRLDAAWDVRLLGMDESCFTVHMSRSKIGWYEWEPEFLKKTEDAIRARIFGLTMEFAENALKILCEEMKKKGELTYFDYLLYTRDMLKADAESGGALIRHIHGRHSYFLIDEFQDTDPLQAEVFFYLASEHPDPDWRKCVPAPGSLFIVGDPKQSIYRFRNADVGAYQRVRGLFTGDVGSHLLLTANYRSTSEMCAWFNRAFSDLLPEDTENQSRFLPIPPTHKPLSEDTFGGVYSYEVKQGKDALSEERDPARVLEILRKLAHNPAFLIREKNDPAPREITWRDFMVITYSKKRLADYAETLTRASVPYVMEGKVRFADCPAMRSLVKLYAAAARPNSVKNLYGALTSEYGGLDEKRLLRFKQSGGVLSLWADQPEDADETARQRIGELREFAFAASSLSPAALFQKVLEDTRIFAKTGMRSPEYVWYALELLRSKETDGTIATIEEASDFLNELIENDKLVERCLSLNRSADRVHIANLHKVKGLEAPIVILASPMRKGSKISVRMDFSTEPPTSRFFRLSEEGAEYLSCGDPGEAGELETRSAEAERIRLLYVAATRARRALILSYHNKKDGTPSSENAWTDFLAYGAPDFFESIANDGYGAEQPAGTADAETLYAESEKPVSETTASRDRSYRVMRPSSVKLKRILSQEDDYEDREETETRSEEAQRRAAFTGTLVHRLMELLVMTKNQVSAEELVREICGEYEAPSDPYEPLLKNVCEQIRAGGYVQDNGAPRDILAELLSAEEVHCELPFCRKAEDGGESVLWNGVMDAVYLKDGKWHIIDYKTNAEAERLDEKYEGQLEAYREAFLSMTSREADTLIYHISV